MTQINKKKGDRQNKRRLATSEGVIHDLKDEGPRIFKAFHKAKALFRQEVVNTPPIARSRTFEASLLLSKIMQCIQEEFPTNHSTGKYKRFILRINGYMILFKKLDRNNLPMYIKTKSAEAISQQLSIPMFDETTFVEEPILFFGYQKTALGEIVAPQFIYIDENNVKWILTEDHFGNDSATPDTPTVPIAPIAPIPLSPIVKPRKTITQKKAN